MSKPLRACVDWAQATFKSVKNPQKIIEIIGLEYDDFVEVESGMYGYKKQLRSGSISILYDGSDDMGIHLQMTGQGCRQYETSSSLDWKGFFLKCFEYDATFTRIDIAIDDIAYVGEKLYFTLPMLIRKLKDGEVRSRFKKAKYITTVRIEDGEELGSTLYFGQPSSDIQLRFYEKNYERLAVGKELEEKLTGWNRTEIQARRERANALALYILNEDQIGTIAAGVLRNYISFCVRDNDTNKARWKVCKWWDKFLGDVEPLKLTLIAPDKTIERTIAWLDNSVAPSLAMVFTALDGDLDKIKELIINGQERMTKEQLRLAKEYSDKKKKLSEDS